MKFKKEINLGQIIIILFLVLILVFLIHSFSKNNFEKIENKEQNFAAQNSAPTKKSPEKLYEIKNIFDGDTIQIIYQGEKKSVRILGINTPEKTGGPYRTRECFGDEASLYAKKILKDKKVKLIFDQDKPKHDKYGRLLAYISINGQEDFGEKMIKDGYAYEYTYHGQKYQNQKKYKTAQKYAEKHQLGLWSENTCAGKK